MRRRRGGGSLGTGNWKGRIDKNKERKRKKRKRKGKRGKRKKMGGWSGAAIKNLFDDRRRWWCRDRGEKTGEGLKKEEKEDG